jgi:signal transduction histidine kinase/8-oxo-dGTP pyrophosphatase MutT (NUDIX family)
LPIRVAAVVTLAGLVLFLLLAKASTAVVARTLTHALDSELTAAVNAVTPAVVAGRPAPQLPGPGTDVRVRVLDRAGTSVDGGGPTSLSVRDIRRLLAGQAVWTSETGSTSRAGQPTRWSGRVVSTPDGTPRLVVAAAEPVAYQALVGRTAVALAVAAVLAALAMGAAGWVAARFALRPVARLRDAATELPAGKRLPLPPARDELRALAEAFNDLLARRDAAARRLRQFTGDAAHELRSPVAAIRAQAEVAVAHPDPDLAGATLEDIATEARRLSVLLDDLLELARSDAGERLNTQPVDLAEMARDAVGRVARRAVVVRVTAAAPAVLHAAPSDVSRVLDNLLANAVRHARSTARVMVLPGPAEIRVLVDDDGDGVPLEHRGLVFERFHRVQEDRDRGTGGAGLGLALVAETVRRYGGTARVGQAPGGGARFEVRWPVGRPSAANPVSRSAIPTEHQQDASLVVAVALVRDGWVLAQRRAFPPDTAGRWELPGGRAEPGESVAEALIRECREELAVDVVPGEQLGPDVPLPGGSTLRVHVARLAQLDATPVPVEHAALRWVDLPGLAELDWLEADRVVLPDLAALLKAQRNGRLGDPR